MRIQPIVPVQKVVSCQNDLYNRRMELCNNVPRETILRSEVRPDGKPFTLETALEQIKIIDPSYVVNLNNNDIPSFLYNKDGKIT